MEMNNWFVEKKKETNMILIMWLFLEITLLLDVCPKIYVIILGIS